MPRGDPDQLLLGRGRDRGSRPREQSGHDDGRGLTRALDPKQQRVILGRRLQELAA